MFVPIRDAVIITRAKPATVRKWAERGDLQTEMGYDGEPWYCVADLIEMEAKHREENLQHGYAKLAKCLLEGA